MIYAPRCVQECFAMGALLPGANEESRMRRFCRSNNVNQRCGELKPEGTYCSNADSLTSDERRRQASSSI